VAGLRPRRFRIWRGRVHDDCGFAIGRNPIRHHRRRITSPPHTA
jgi:hypothetical protein